MEQPKEQTAQDAAALIEKEEKLEAILAETAGNTAESPLTGAAEPSAPDADTPEQDHADPETEKPESEEDSYNLKSFFNDTLDLIESVITSIFIVILVFTFLFCVANVEGDSMLPTLEDGNRLLVSRLKKDYDDGDILILDSETSYQFGSDGNLTGHPGLGKEIVKRLIAQGGQVVNIDFAAGIVYVDGEPLDEPYTSTLTTRDHGAFTYPFTVPEGYVFVLGDNRHISRDSRHPDIGLVKEEDIIGKVIIRLSPFSEFGKVS